MTVSYTHLVPEYDVKDIELGQKLMIKPEVFEKKKSYPGVVTKISRISKVSETTSENVLEVEVKPDEAIPYIVPGFKVSAIISVSYTHLDVYKRQGYTREDYEKEGLDNENYDGEEEIEEAKK